MSKRNKMRGSIFAGGHQALTRGILKDSEVQVISRGKDFVNINDFPVICWMVEFIEYCQKNDPQVMTRRIVDEIWYKAKKDLRRINKIMIAETPEWVTRQYINRLDGGILHESFHSLFTVRGTSLDTRKISDIMERHFDPEVNYGARGKALKTLNNIFEDAFIERHGIQKFRGAKNRIQSVHELVWEREKYARQFRPIGEPMVDENGDPLKDDKGRPLVHPRTGQPLRAMSALSHLTCYLRDKVEFYLRVQPFDEYPEQIRRIVDEMFKEILEESRNTTSSYDTFELAMKSLGIIANIFELVQMHQQQQGDGEGEGQQSQGDGESGDGSGKFEQIKNGDPSDSSSSGGSGSTGGDENDENDDNEEGEGGGGEDSDGDNSEDQSSGNEEDEENSDSDDGSEKEGEGEDSEEEGEDSENDGDGDNEEDEKDGEDSENAGEGEDEENSDSNPLESGPDRSHGSEETKKEAGEPNDDEDPDDLSDIDDDLLKEMEDQDASTDSVKDIGSSLKQEWDDQVSIEAPPSVLPFSREVDEIILLESSGTEDEARMYNKVADQVKSDTLYIRPRMLSFFRGQKKSRLRHRRETGRRLSSRSVSEVVYKKRPRPFMIKENTTRRNSCVSLVIDESGSMRYKRNMARQILSTLALTIGQLKIPLEIIGFTTNDRDALEEYLRENPRQDTREYRREVERIFTRTQGCQYRVFRSFDEPFNIKSWRKLVQTEATGLTPLPDAIEFAAKRIVNRKEEQKIIFVVTDGYPCYHHNWTTEDYLNIMKCQMEDLQKSDVEVLFIGVGADFVKKYPNSLVISDINNFSHQMAQFIFEQMKRLLI